MEPRIITIVSQATSKKSVIKTTAATLGELKQALAANNISYDGMTFHEGLTNSEYRQDNAILPTNVPYKGTTTNDLVFMLTQPNKKISSGTDRSVIIGIIKSNNLSKEVMNRFHKNFTNCKSEALEGFLKEMGLLGGIQKSSETEDISDITGKEVEPTEKEEVSNISVGGRDLAVLTEALRLLTITIGGLKISINEKLDNILEAVQDFPEHEIEEMEEEDDIECPYNEDDLDDILDNIE